GWSAFWSPDGTSIGFFAAGKLQRVAAAGGSPQTLADAGYARGGTWSGDVILYATTSYGGLRRVAANGGPSSEVLPLERGEISQRWPVFLSDGRHFLFLSMNSNRGDGDIVLGSI